MGTHTVDGRIVLVNDDHRLFAKLLEVDGEKARVEFFHSVAERTSEWVSISNISRIELPRETRVFLELSSGHWRVGRVIAQLSEPEEATLYDVRFPNSQDKEVSEIDLFVRCMDARADPALALAFGCAETQSIADRRRRALKAVRGLRSACEGLTGPYSSAIELMPHQLSNVRRVLQDTHIRYLLADEVGLGKTIEAGCILRQLLLDRRDLKAAILVPKNLVSQWQTELETRFFIESLGMRVEVLPYEKYYELEEAPELLIIDEAHRVVAVKDGAESEVFNSIEALAHKAKYLLLLSATPALGDEARLFGLLHLLDPSAYPTGDLEGFRRKVSSRQDIGRLLLSMQPDSPSFVLKTQAKSAIAMFPDDQFVNSVSTDVIETTDDEARGRSIILLRDHIARTYRIHDRLLRSRRREAEVWAMRPRADDWPNLSHVRLSFDNTAWSGDLSEALDAWRTEASSAEESFRDPMVARWRELVTASFQGRKALARVLKPMSEAFPGEVDYLHAIRSLADSDVDRESRLTQIQQELFEWYEELRSASSNRTPKIVCFQSDERDVAELYRGIRARFGSYEIVNISDAIDETERNLKIETFRNDPQQWILIGDRSAEEGLNLQFADGIFHLDLPTDVARMEQRIGRLDRFGRKLPRLEHRIFLPNDDEDAPWYGWMDLLMNGFRIFNQTVSDVQFALESLEGKIWSRSFIEGTGNIEELSDWVAETIDTERTKLDEQHALDEIANLGENVEQLVERMEDAEADEDDLAAAVSGWVNQTLYISQSPKVPKRHETFRLFWDRPLLPRIPWKKVLEPVLDRPLTWRRVQTQSMREAPLLLRPGSVFFDAIERIANWDDRGTAYATWRVDPDLLEPWVGFRWIWVVSPGLSSEAAVWGEVDRPDLYRRTEMYLPIFDVERWTDFEGNPVADEPLFRIINRPYAKEETAGHFDINLGSRPDLMARLVDPSMLREALTVIRARCLKDVQSDEIVVAAIDAARARFERDDALIRQSILRRQSYLQETFGQPYEGAEDMLADLDTIRQAVEKPQIRLDECGLMIVSPKKPDDFG